MSASLPLYPTPVSRIHTFHTPRLTQALSSLLIAMKSKRQYSLGSLLILAPFLAVLLILLWPNPRGVADGGGLQTITVFFEQGAVKIVAIPMRKHEDANDIIKTAISRDQFDIYSVVEPERILVYKNPASPTSIDIKQNWSCTFRGSLDKRSNFSQTFDRAAIVISNKNGENETKVVDLPAYCESVSVSIDVDR